MWNHTISQKKVFLQIVESYNFSKKKWFCILHLGSPLFPADALDVLQPCSSSRRINPEQLARKKTPSVRTLQQIHHTNYTKITNTKYKNYQLYETKIMQKISSVRTLQQIRHTFNPAADKSKPLTWQLTTLSFVRIFGKETHHFVRYANLYWWAPWQQNYLQCQSPKLKKRKNVEHKGLKGVDNGQEHIFSIFC